MKPVIIGAGLAGLTTALSLAPMPVILLSPKKLGEECASAWAQGGIAIAVGDDDSAAVHAEDTLAAGAGLCDPAVVQAVTTDGAAVLDFLESKGVAFDKKLGLEAAHRRRRILHAADHTGASIMRALIQSARTTPSIEIIEETSALELLTEGGNIAGVVVQRGGSIFALPTKQVVLATGGAGALWQQTSNPLGSWGRGLLLAARAGAVMADLEFMQFHPTAIDVGRDPMPLASEALRGEGCTLVDDAGERFTDELQPRDVVTRAICAQQAKGRKIFLDARSALGANFAKRFPSIYAMCMAAGIDPAQQPIPVSPAAHYHMGGVLCDVSGRTNVEGLWVCGEVASTGLHGANRLASNSLLETASFARRVAQDIQSISPSATHARMKAETRIEQNDGKIIRSIMSQHVGVLRKRAGLQRACDELAPLAATSGMATVGLLIATSALRREESRGAHARTDFPETSAAWRHHQYIALADIQPFLEPITKRRTGT